MNPRVSVIIPNYNHNLFLHQRIESVLNQTYSNFELILLDDNSIDGSQNIINSYSSHPKITKIVINSVNSGSVFKQWIKGIELCLGEYIWIAESDDWANETFLEETIQVIERSSTIGMVFTDSIRVDEVNKELGLISKKNVFEELIKHNNCIDRSNLITFLLEKLVVLNASSVLFRKSAFDQVDFEELEKYKNVGDVFTYISIAFQFKIIYLNKPLNYLRQHQNRTTDSNFKNGVLQHERLKLLNWFLDCLCLIEVEYKKGVINYYNKLLFPGLDFNYTKELKCILKKIRQYYYISRFRYVQLFCLIKCYNFVTNKGKFYLIRNFLKKYLRCH